MIFTVVNPKRNYPKTIMKTLRNKKRKKIEPEFALPVFSCVAKPVFSLKDTAAADKDFKRMFYFFQ